LQGWGILPAGFEVYIMDEIDTLRLLLAKEVIRLFCILWETLVFMSWLFFFLSRNYVFLIFIVVYGIARYLIKDIQKDFNWQGD